MIAEDHKFWRDSSAALLMDFPERYEVIGKAEDGKILLELVAKRKPDFILLDIHMPVLGGMGALKILKEQYPDVNVIVVSAEFSEFRACDAILNGARGYMTKTDFNLENVNSAIESIQEHGYYFNHSISKDIIRALHQEKKIYYLIQDQRFSMREIEVLRLICSDITPDQIADSLKISANTVKFHRSNLIKKTEADSIVSLVSFAIRQGIYPELP